MTRQEREIRIEYVNFESDTRFFVNYDTPELEYPLSGNTF